MRLADPCHNISFGDAESYDRFCAEGSPQGPKPRRLAASSCAKGEMPSLLLAPFMLALSMIFMSVVMLWVPG